jgi:four helix bundle protein
MRVALSIYRDTESFPKHETFGLTAQLRRCAVSVPSNIAEGHGRITTGEWRQFLGQARGSTLEMQTQLMLALRLGYGDAKALESDLASSEELGRVINGLLTSTGSRPGRKPFNEE